MHIDRQSRLSILFRLRQELGMPINTIIGYSEIIIEEIEELDRKVEYLAQLEQIRECGVELLASMNALLNPEISAEDPSTLFNIVSNAQLRTELEKPTKLVLDCCRDLSSLADMDFAEELKKIDGAANKLLAEIQGAKNLSLQQVESFGGGGTKAKLTRKDADPRSAKYSILIVDDSATNRELLAYQVEAQGYRVSTAADGKQAIQMIQTGSYDLILLDIIMPEVDGYEVLEWIRQSPWQHIPTIMISALDRLDSVVKCIEMGAEDYLAKPFNQTLLKARLGACLEQKRLRDSESLYLKQLARANQQINQFNNSLQVENTRLSTELEVSQRLQTMLLPKEKELDRIEALEIAGYSESAAEVGGDYYDVLQHEGRVIIGIGDVSGHGLESGVLMLMVQTAVRTLIENGETNPKKFFEILNRTIYKNAQRMDSDKMLSLCLVDYYDGVLSISGQHEEILILRQNGAVERIDTIDLGFPIGLEETIEDFVFQTQIPLKSQEVVVLYTDGITEAENDGGLQYGIERLCQVVEQNYQLSAQNIRQEVIQDLRSHIGIEQVYDDITLVVLKRK